MHTDELLPLFFLFSSLMALLKKNCRRTKKKFLSAQLDEGETAIPSFHLLSFVESFFWARCPRDLTMFIWWKEETQLSLTIDCSQNATTAFGWATVTIHPPTRDFAYCIIVIPTAKRRKTCHLSWREKFSSSHQSSVPARTFFVVKKAIHGKWISCV